MNHVMKWYKDVLGRQTVDALVKHNVSAYYCPDRKEAIRLIIMQLIPDSATIGVSGSRTVMELGLVELLKKCRHEIFNCNPEGLILEAKSKEWSRQLTCDIFLTGANAITLTGEIVNRDAFGRRIVAMMFGPKKVIVVAGIDKVVRDVDAAKGQEASAPCAEPGECVDCSTLRQSGNITSMLHRYPPLTDIHVVIVGECLSLSNH